VPDADRRAAPESYLAGPPAVLDDIRRQFGRMIEHDATTCWEMYPNFAENRASEDMLTRSHCHGWSAARVLEPDGRTMHLRVTALPHVAVTARLPEGFTGTIS